jgi:hypothetical protein
MEDSGMVALKPSGECVGGLPLGSRDLVELSQCGPFLGRRPQRHLACILQQRSTLAPDNFL